MLRRGMVIAVLAGMALGAAAQEAPEETPQQLSDLDQAQVQRMQQMSITELLREARRLIDDEDYIGAAPYLQLVERRDPENMELKPLLARAMLHTGEFERARELFLEVHRINSSDFQANLGLGQLYLQARQWRQSLRYLEVAEATAPPDQTALVLRLLAEAYRGSGQYVKAIETAERAVTTAPDDYGARYALVGALIDAQNFERAVTEAEQMERIAEREMAENPGDRAALDRLIRAQSAYVSALRSAFVSMMAMGPDGQPTDEPAEGKEAEAAATLSRIVQLLAQLAESRRLQSIYDLMPFAEKMVEYQPENAAYWRDYGLLLAETRQRGEAIEAFEKAVELNPQDTVARTWLEQMRGGSPSAPDTDATGGDGD